MNWWIVGIGAAFLVGRALGLAQGKAKLIEMVALFIANQQQTPIPCPACSEVGEHSPGCPLAAVASE